MEDELLPGSYINCKIIGVLETRDDEGDDPKLIACPSSKVDPTYDTINNIYDLNRYVMDKIQFFFQHYKDLERKKVEVGKFLDKSSAIQIYKESIDRFNVNKKQ